MKTLDGNVHKPPLPPPWPILSSEHFSILTRLCILFLFLAPFSILSPTLHVQYNAHHRARARQAMPVPVYRVCRSSVWWKYWFFPLRWPPCYDGRTPLTHPHIQIHTAKHTDWHMTIGCWIVCNVRSFHTNSWIRRHIVRVVEC